MGQVTLKPRALTAYSALSLNADAGEGAVRVELLDAGGRRVRGFSAEDSIPIHGDSLQHAVRWKERSLSTLPAGEYMIRLHLRKATVYAVDLAP